MEEEWTFKKGDRVRILSDISVLYSDPPRSWRGVEATVAYASEVQSRYTNVDLEDLNIDYAPRVVGFFASSLELIKAVEEEEEEEVDADEQSRWMAEGMKQAGAEVRPVGSKVYSSHQGGKAPGVIVKSNEAFPPYNYGVTFGGEPVILHHSHLSDRKHDTVAVKAIDLKLKDKFLFEGEVYTVTELMTGINNVDSMVMKGYTKGCVKQYPRYNGTVTQQNQRIEKIVNDESE